LNNYLLGKCNVKDFVCQEKVSTYSFTSCFEVGLINDAGSAIRNLNVFHPATGTTNDSLCETSIKPSISPSSIRVEAYPERIKTNRKEKTVADIVYYKP